MYPYKFLGLIGQDETGSALTNLLQHQKIDCNFVALDTHPTITKLRILSRHQQLLRLDFRRRFPKRRMPRVASEIRS